MYVCVLERKKERDSFDSHLHNEVSIIIQIISISTPTFVNGDE